jgi:RimJ/RimL family protein N-acetyltransferase
LSSDFRHVEAARLELDAVVPADLDEHFALMSDPGVWAHLPSGRHTDPTQTAAGIEHSVGHWERNGLGYWTVRLREDLTGTPLRAGGRRGHRRLRRPGGDGVVEPPLPAHADGVGPRAGR